MRARRVILIFLVVLLTGCHLISSGGSLESDLRAEVAPEDVWVPSKPRIPQNPWCFNNSAQVHVGPADNTAALRDLLRNAQSTLFIEAYQLADDALGQEISGLAIAAAKRGVAVRFLCDDFGTGLRGGQRLGAGMKAAGVDFRTLPTRYALHPGPRRGLNISHRKLYLADGNRGLVGGYNLISPFAATTRDLLVDFRGEVAAQLHQEFARDWLLASGPPLTWPKLPEKRYGTVAARTLVTSPLEGRFEAREALYQAIDEAKWNIEVEQQYLWEPGTVERLSKAARRGVAVRVLIPGETDSIFFKGMHAMSLNALVQAGAQAHVYHERPNTGHLHAKYFSIDDSWAAFGSVNGNTRAMTENQELDVVTTDEGLVAELKTRLFEHDWSLASTPYRLEHSFWLGPLFLPLWKGMAAVL